MSHWLHKGSISSASLSSTLVFNNLNSDLYPVPRNVIPVFPSPVRIRRLHFESSRQKILQAQNHDRQTQVC